MTKSENNIVKISQNQGASGFVLFMAYIGAVAYFFGQQPDFWGLVLALIKAIVWPAFLINSAFSVLGV